MFKRYPVSFAVALVLCVVVSNAVLATSITSASYFTSLPHTLITFNVDGSGKMVNLAEGASVLMPGDEYASQGVIFHPAIHWVNDRGTDFDAAQIIGGSPQIGFPTGHDDDFSITFTTPAKAFGLWVINNNTAFRKPTFTAYDATGNVIESVTFDSTFIQGTIGVADYGFMGIAADRYITRVIIGKDATMFDNLYIAVPEPSSILILICGISGIYGGLRRNKGTTA